MAARTSSDRRWRRCQNPGRECRASPWSYWLLTGIHLGKCRKLTTPAVIMSQAISIIDAWLQGVKRHSGVLAFPQHVSRRLSNRLHRVLPDRTITRTLQALGP